MADVNNNNRMVLLLIAGLPLTMILAATWLWVYVEQGDIDLVDILGTANRGELVAPPRALAELGIPAPAVDNADWTILIPARNTCDRQCEHLLYYTRQIRTAMGKYTKRIRLGALVFDPALATELAARLEAEHPNLEFLYTPQSRWQQLMDDVESRDVAPGYYLVDPQGWIMMSYQPEADGKDVMADLKFLLKNSSG